MNTDVVPQQENEQSLLAPFSPELFVEHRGWDGLEQILRGSGAGSYGLSGPRGAGKTWMMERALERTDEDGGLGIWFPSPSEYEPTAFIAALSDVVAARYEAYYDSRTGHSTKAARSRFRLYYGAGGLLAYLSIGALILTNLGGSSSIFSRFLTLSNSLLILFALGGVVLAFYATRRYRDDREGLGRVRREAEDLRRQVRYAVSATESDEVGISGAYAGIGAGLKRARERQLVERPATLSSLIHNFRAFVRMIATELDGRVVIAVDELDKMSDAARVAQLLRDIKGIFEIPGACFLVSLSDEAARALELGAVRARNEFNSSFYTVISLPPLPPRDCVSLLHLRDPSFDPDCGLAIGILTGGISRELVRVAELVRLRSGPVPSVHDAVAIAMTEELDAFSAWILQTAGSSSRAAGLGDQARVALFESVEEVKAELSGNSHGLSSRMLSEWDLNQGNGIWKEQFAEEWRRLLVRIGVAGVVIGRPGALRDPGSAAELQHLVTISSASSAVGRHRLELMLDQEEAFAKSRAG